MVGHYLTPVLRKTIIEIIKESKRYLEDSELILIYWWPGIERSQLSKEASKEGIMVHEVWMAGPINQAKIHGWYKNFKHYIKTKENEYNALEDKMFWVQIGSGAAILAISGFAIYSTKILGTAAK